MSRRRRSYRKRMRSYAAGKLGVSRFAMSMWPPVLKLLGVILGIAAVVLVIIFVVVPWTRGDFVSIKLPEPSYYHTPGSTSGSEDIETRNDLSEFAKDANVGFNSMNDPFICGDEIVFSRAVAVNGVSRYAELYVYDCATEETSKVDGISLKYDNILQPKLSTEFLVWIDSNVEGGGRICAMKRDGGKQFVVKEFAFATPTLRIDGNMICFIQQAGDDLDKLYVYDLGQRESICLETFSGLPTPITSADISGKDIVYAVPALSDGVYRSRVYRYDLKTGEKIQLNWATYTENPRTDGKYVLFGTTSAGLSTSDLYVEKGKNSPVNIATGVTNYDMGDGFAVYTKDATIYVYDIDTGQTCRLSSDRTRGLLYGASGSGVCWYDITNGYTSIDVCKYAILELD